MVLFQVVFFRLIAVSVQFSRNLAIQCPAKITCPIPPPIMQKKMKKILQWNYNWPIREIIKLCHTTLLTKGNWFCPCIKSKCGFLPDCQCSSVPWLFLLFSGW